ncbi:GNAT family N-acetyltransferase [Labilibacter marinus]|uniref:GNAT family N-acetyltransferase n=1 Tax=Labilibacter marinus TaxID=1477105 RepID=UPI0008350984|nr:GNAT family N-acetyltransferase [Labilibacter marinus]
MQLNNQLTISCSKEKLDIPMIYDFLSNRSYWGKGRTLEQVESSISNSICFGIYLKDKQVAFARVVSDKVVFAWVMDVFVLEEYRGQGIGKTLMKSIIEYPELKQVRKIGLATDDAHGLYQQYGFTSLIKPENLMERVMS